MSKIFGDLACSDKKKYGDEIERVHYKWLCPCKTIEDYEKIVHQYRQERMVARRQYSLRIKRERIENLNNQKMEIRGHLCNLSLLSNQTMLKRQIQADELLNSRIFEPLEKL